MRINGWIASVIFGVIVFPGTSNAWGVIDQAGGQWVQPPTAPIFAAPEGQADEDDTERQMDVEGQWSPVDLPALQEQHEDDDAE